jgi:hypothetical protein
VGERRVSTHVFVALSIKSTQNIPMIQTVEGIIDEQGRVKLPSDIRLPSGRRAIVTVLDENGQADTPETALLSEKALGEDWLRPEEDEAWQHLQTEQ